MKRPSPILLGLSITLLCLSGAMACRRKPSQKIRKTVIQNTGSDTMVNLAQAWAEEYAHLHPEISVEVSGGGSGTGIAALIAGTVDIANASRNVEAQEIQRARDNTGKEPLEHRVGFDALVVYVHKDNPLQSISLEQLGEIYAEKGRYTKWSDMGIEIPGARDEIIRISRQSNSGTYHYFREAVLGKKTDFKLGSLDLHGSKDVVELITRTPGAIGYSGMGYAMPGAKQLAISKKGGKPVAPTVESTLKGSYPIARPLLMYTLGPASGATQAYLDWTLSEQGQKIVLQSGYVPLPRELWKTTVQDAPRETKTSKTAPEPKGDKR